VSAAQPSLRSKAVALERAQPLSAHLELTYRCNWRCVFCYNPRHHDIRGLSGEEWTRVLDGLRGLGTLWLTLTGGEPLAHPRFFGIARAARERHFAFSVFTNGALVDDAAADELARLGPVVVELSLHGADAATHDRATGRPGSFEAFTAGLDRLRERSVPVLLKSPLTRLNEHAIEKLIAFAERRGAPLRIDPTITPRDDGDAGPLDFAPSPAAVSRLYRLLSAAGQLPSSHREPGGSNCGLGRLTLAVDPEGDVYPCAQWRRRPLGNVREASIDEIWRGSEERRAAAAVASAANDRMLALGEPFARFPFCPALALQHSADPLEPYPEHQRLAALAAAERSAH